MNNSISNLQNIRRYGFSRTNTSLFFAVLLLCSLFISGFSENEKSDELEQVRQKFRDGKVLHAEMTHQIIDSYTGESQVTEGVLWISKHQYKIQADRQAVLVDGETSRVYNEQQNKVIISDYEPEEDDFAPSRFFSGPNDIFFVDAVEKKNDHIRFVLRSEDPFEIFTEVNILLDDRLIPVEIYAVDQMDNKLETSFRGAEYLDFSESLFELSYPENAEIIDLRK